jgi:hypothetical protein
MADILQLKLQLCNHRLKLEKYEKKSNFYQKNVLLILLKSENLEREFLKKIIMHVYISFISYRSLIS